ncbi:hypothetical protein M0G43_08460 [Subsaxibacter sp. CAU 1640]|uniref:hypothetical protein n=1 Tax=Subsaxibacter sp. CAU 1640 TaxID=2933271 RepID=UPI0020031318|nr:hypothetical protein [Subsaxibacter sp. CAU 1640]MCK7590602.1 hypothetical protein [Subsaxibacter sp. CAU 1640]
MSKTPNKRARVSKKAQLAENVKNQLSNEAQDHNFDNETVESQPKSETPVQEDQETSTNNQHSIAVSSKVEEEEDKRNKRYAASMTNTITRCGEFISLATTMEPNYATNIPMYELANLKIIQNNANGHMDTVEQAETSYKYAVAMRVAEFSGLAPLGALIIAEMVLANALPETIEQLRTLMRLLRGERKVPKDPSNPMANYRSVSQLNYDDVTTNFRRLLLMIAADPNYNPATVAIQLVTLQAKLVSLETANANVQTKKAELDAARMARNEFFNAPVTGLVAVFINAKKVVLTNFGRKSEQFARVKGLEFRKIRTR